MEIPLKNMDVIILAGGKGLRLREAVSDRPKIMADVNGTPFLHLLLQHLRLTMDC